MLTQKHHLAILCWDSNGELRTRASGHIADRVGRHSETGIIACVHSSGVSTLTSCSAFEANSLSIFVIELKNQPIIYGLNTSLTVIEYPTVFFLCFIDCTEVVDDSDDRLLIEFDRLN